LPRVSTYLGRSSGSRGNPCYEQWHGCAFHMHKHLGQALDGLAPRSEIKTFSTPTINTLGLFPDLPMTTTNRRIAQRLDCCASRPQASGFVLSLHVFLIYHSVHYVRPSISPCPARFVAAGNGDRCSDKHANRSVLVVVSATRPNLGEIGAG
jgi:hypothetical protein